MQSLFQIEKHLRKITLLSLLSVLSMKVYAQRDTMPPGQVNYHLSWDGHSPLLKVDIYYRGTEKDSTEFFYGNPELGGQAAIFEIFKNPVSGIGDRLIIDPRKRKVLVLHSASGISKLHYEIDGRLIVDPKRARPNELFRPVIAATTLYSLGYNLFLNSSDINVKKISVVWDVHPAGIPFLVSSSLRARPEEPQTLAADKMGNFMVLMDTALIIKKYQVYRTTYYAITSKRDTISDMQVSLKPFFTQFFPSIQDFWEDHRADEYFIGMLPLFNQVDPTATGVNLGNGFSMKYSGRYDAMKMEVVAHETSHTWIGKALRLKSTGYENAWFSEGFNDYIALFNLVRTGMMDRSGFLNHVNITNLKKHYTNPDNTAPADSVEKYFWKKPSYEGLSYQRGFIYAFYLDNQIRLASNGKYNIRHFLLRFFQQTRGLDRLITTDDLLNAISIYLPRQKVAVQIEDYMKKGKLIDFHQIKLISDFRVGFNGTVPFIILTDKTNLRKIYNW